MQIMAIKTTNTHGPSVWPSMIQIGRSTLKRQKRKRTNKRIDHKKSLF